MKTLNILVVDDDRDFAETMAEVLEGRGHSVELAFSGREAVSKFCAQDFDVAFIDVMLPDMSGVKSFAEIKAKKPGARVVMMTAFSVEQLLEEAFENGALGVLHKPLNMEQVLEFVDKSRPRGAILIADDDREACQTLKDELEPRGYKIHVAHDGASALAQARAGGIDLMLLDLKMPVMSGFDVYMELERSGETVPTIIVTGYAEEESDAIRELNSRSVATVFTKPFDMKKLLDSIDKLASEGS